MRVDAITKRRVRGVILRLVLQKHEHQEHRYDDYALLAALDRLSFELHLDVVREILQDMRDRDLVALKENRDRKSGETSITGIQLRPRGRNLLEGLEKDVAVEVE
jgi:hypothetical protein